MPNEFDKIAAEVEKHGRPCDTKQAGWLQVKGAWQIWPATERALSLTYYATHFPVADRQYCLAGLTRYFEEFQLEHGHRNIPQHFLDLAAAKEVNYHAFRGRQFKRACAALCACWIALISERPERIFDPHARALARLAQTGKKPEWQSIPNSSAVKQALKKAL
jgi:hypothetical protein